MIAYPAGMGRTNYQHALRKKYSALTGERDLLRERIERIRGEQDLLPELEARAAKLDALADSAAMLLQEEGDWRLCTLRHTSIKRRHQGSARWESALLARV